MSVQQKNCIKCKKNITVNELYKIIIYVVQEKFSDHYYQHIECPENFTV